jgi:hypothetical protein
MTSRHRNNGHFSQGRARHSSSLNIVVLTSNIECDRLSSMDGGRTDTRARPHRADNEFAMYELDRRTRVPVAGWAIGR